MYSYNCILILFAFLVFVIIKCFCKKESFSNKKNKENDIWKKRFGDLNKVVPLFYKWYFNQVKDTPNRSQKPPMKKNKIFISIASYRDDQCFDTVRNLSENADNPENLVIVVCQQNGVADRDCLGWCQKNKKHPTCNKTDAKIERLSHISARGPTWARWRIQRKWDGEEYYLQLDAHTRMVPHWDTILKEQLSLCPSEKPVLTQYPLEYTIVNNKKDRNSSVKENWQLDKMRGGLYVKEFSNPDGFFRVQSDYTEGRQSQPFQATCWGACFSFSRGDFFWEVGYDPYTPFLFFGEEMDISARGWTWGWDYFSPSETVVFTSFKREHRSTFWENPLQWPLEILSRFRVYVRLGYITKDKVPKKYHFIFRDMDKYPLGPYRSLSDYEKMCRMNIKNEKTNV